MDEKTLQFKNDLEKFAKTNNEISLYAIAKCIGIESIPMFELRQIINDFLFYHPDFYFTLKPGKTRHGYIKLLGEGYLKRIAPVKRDNLHRNKT